MIDLPLYTCKTPDKMIDHVDCECLYNLWVVEDWPVLTWDMVVGSMEDSDHSREFLG